MHSTQAISDTLWATGLVLQCALLGRLAHRGVARSLPIFTGLLTLYLLRSIFLFAAFGRLSADAYQAIYATLSWLDILLQMAVAWELVCGGWKNLPAAGTFRTRLGIFAALVTLAAAAAWAISLAVPGDPHSPIDRGVLFPGSLLLLVAITAILRHYPPAGSAARRILEGFAALEAMTILSQVERTLTALHRNGKSYRNWSYVAAISYLVVVVFWLLTVPSEKTLTPAKRARKRLA